MLPREVEYRVSSLPPEVSSASYVSRAVNGTSFTAGQQAQVNLIQNRGAYFIPSSFYVTFNINVTADAANDNAILGIPACSVISRLDTFANSTSIETVNNYNAVTNMLFNGKLGVSEKCGLSKPFGLQLTAGYADMLTDSRTITAGTGANIVSCSVPICSVLSNSEKLIPADSAEYRLYFTIEDIANIACLTANGNATDLTLYSVSDFEVHYKCVT